MIKKIYGLMGGEEKRHYSMLLALEINSYLHKIYSTMRRKVPLKPARLSPQMIVMKHASLGATKMWEFILNSREQVAKGDVGKVIVVTRGLESEAVRKQRALFIAAEFYTYHAFANHPDPRRFSSIRCQNQYLDMAKKLFGRENAHDIRDHAIRYVVEEIKEHRLAHYRHTGWFVSIAKLKRHHPEMAAMLGSSERTFREIVRKQRQLFTPDMLKQEEDLVRKEIEDLDHLARMLKEREHARMPPQLKALMGMHLDNLRLFKGVLERIMLNLDAWVVVDKEEHSTLRKRLSIPSSELHKLLLAEAEAEEVDINKVHIIFSHFKKEKINILRDLELIDRVGPKAHR